MTRPVLRHRFDDAKTAQRAQYCCAKKHAAVLGRQ
jgi:hypothetical protein